LLVLSCVVKAAISSTADVLTGCLVEDRRLADSTEIFDFRTIRPVAEVPACGAYPILPHEIDATIPLTAMVTIAKWLI
jgi:hypothetical protein